MDQNYLTQTEFQPIDLENAIKEEFYSPFVLPYKRLLINHIVEKISEKENYLTAELQNKSTSFEFDILTLELDRVKYYLKKYLRTRLTKIERNIFFIFQNDLASYLSKSEFNFALSYYTLLTKQFSDNFLSKVDEKYGQRLFNQNIMNNSKSTVGLSIVDSPDDNRFVFVKFNAAIANMILDRGTTQKFQKNDILLVAFKYVKTLVEEEKAVLI